MSREPENRWAELLRGVERPARYTGGEFGLPGPPPGGVRLRVALGFPDTYEVGMSHLGYRLLHASLLERPDLLVERVFLPYPDMQRSLQQLGLRLTSLESRSPLDSGFDLLGLSVQYELAFPGVLRLLDLAGIPRRARQRAQEGGRWPLVLVGGSAACNPEPLAPFVDAFFLGEADLALAEIVDCLARHREAPRSEALAALARVQGIYVPALLEVEHDPDGLGLRLEARPPAMLPVQRRLVEDLDALPVPAHHVVPTVGLVHDRVTIEIQRGCSQGCRFCQAGFVSRPTRQRSAGRVLQEARRLLAQTGYQDLALLSLSAGDHPCLQQMLAALIEEHGPRRVAVSLPSLRTETLQRSVAEQIARVRRTTFTLAPEAATDRLRAVINKQNTEADLLRSVDTVVEAGYSRLKLYFMIGLPTETEQDVLAIAELSRRVEARARQRRRGAGLSISVSPFVPKPHTPLQWEPAPAPETVSARLKLLQAELPRRIRLKWHDPGQSLAEAYLARGDRRLAAVLERLVDHDHLGLDSWTEHFRLGRWQRALAEAAEAGEIPSPGLYLGARDPQQTLPWEHMDVGVERSYLLAQRKAALELGETRPDCSDGTCDDCGVCPAEPLHRLATIPPTVAESGNPSPPGEPVAPRRVRVWFHKRGQARHVGHLEMAGVFERAARRAGLPLAFTRGFHPKLRMRFSPALPLGAESLCEFLELGLVQPLSPDEVGRRLAEQLPPGFEIQSWEHAVPRDLLARIEGVRWRLEPAAPITSGELEAARRRLEQGPLWLERKGRRRDLGRLVQELEAGEGGGVEVRCRFDSGGTARPDEILGAVLRLEPSQIRRTAVTRLGWQIARQS